MKLARIVDGVIAEFPQPAAGLKLEDCFHPDFVAALVSVPSSAEVGFVQAAGGGWSAPKVPTTIRAVSGKQLRYALNASAQRKDFEGAVEKAGPDAGDWWAAKMVERVPETSPKLIRVAGIAGIDLEKLFSAAEKL